MENNKSSQNIVIVALCAVVITMSVAFAAFTQNLQINGTVGLANASWNVKFDTTSYHEGENSVTVSAEDRTLTGTTFEYNVILENPGDFYEFTLDVINTGTFDAKLTAITMTELTEEQSKYLKYEVTYDGVTYESSKTLLNSLLVKKTGLKQVKAKVTYLEPEDENDLADSNVSVPLSLTLTYEQA